MSQVAIETETNVAGVDAQDHGEEDLEIAREVVSANVAIDLVTKLSKKMVREEGIVGVGVKIVVIEIETALLKRSRLTEIETALLKRSRLTEIEIGA